MPSRTVACTVSGISLFHLKACSTNPATSACSTTTDSCATSPHARYSQARHVVRLRRFLLFARPITPPLLTFAPDLTLLDAARLMIEPGWDHAVVMDPVPRLITPRSVLRSLVEVPSWE